MAGNIFYRRWTENKKEEKNISPMNSSRSDSFTGRAEKGIGAGAERIKKEASNFAEAQKRMSKV